MTRKRSTRPARLRESETGASAVEYCLVISGVAAVVAIIIFTLGPIAADPWNSACTTLNAVVLQQDC